MSMHDTDDIIPEFESRYHTGPEPQKSETENNGAGSTADRNLSIQISRTFPVVRGLIHAGARGDVYLVEQNGVQAHPQILQT